MLTDSQKKYLSIKLDSHGSVLFKQKRVGKNKKNLDATGKPIVNMNKNRSQNSPVIC